jgi:D-3-phosphoglycerate dehydrogenase / 2-oxoglutarate reductase
VKGACLDVLEYESVSFGNLVHEETPQPLRYILNSDKVVLSPHIAGWTHESNYRMSRLLAGKITVVLKN